MSFPDKCDICARTNINTNMFNGNIELSLRPIKGSTPSVMLVGQDPTVAKGKIYSVLDLDNRDSRLYKYIVGEILEPAGLRIDNVYATDLVKCRFPDNQTPSSICKRHDRTVEEFLSPFFQNCLQWFIQEIDENRPRIILSFGQPVHQLLIEKFAWAVPIGMKEAFVNRYNVSLQGNEVYYVPCIHINSRGHQHYIKNWGKLNQSLKEAAILARIT